MNPPQPFSRRTFLKATAAAALPSPLTASEISPRQATGVRVGEVTDSSATAWVRLTKHPIRNNTGVAFAMPKRGTPKAEPQPVPAPHEIEGTCPPASGKVRLRYATHQDLHDALATPWVEVKEEADGLHHFKLEGLQPGRTYHYLSETSELDGTSHPGFRGKFHTAPSPHTPTDLHFCVMTCQGYQDRDHAEGHPIYPSMLALEPRFIAMTGDVVYYDNNPPRAVSPALARLHWERMFSLPRLITAMRNTSTYWLKDDHDTLSDDCWPGMKAGELTFAEGQQIFREQAPLGPSDYRTIRWGRDLQIWFTEGRDYRSPNNAPDGPEKTIWGMEQKEWFKRTVKESLATWKVLISPTPLVGPDRKNKRDNHSNASFAHEGDEIRGWLQENAHDHFFVICGDRHWQYHSVHPVTGLHEFSVGAASNSHAGGTPGEDKTYHRFHRVKGGFLNVALQPNEDGTESSIAFQLRDVDGNIRYEAKFTRNLS